MEHRSRGNKRRAGFAGSGRASQPRVKFIKRSGGTFTKTFRSRATAKRALLGWRKAGGRIKKVF